MTKVQMFYGGQLRGSLYFLYEPYFRWLEENPHIKVVSTVYDDNTLLVTYEVNQ